MRGALTRVVLTFVVIALLAAPLVYKRVLARHNPPDTTAASALARYGFQLTKSAKVSGISFVHKAPTLDPKLNHIMEQVASMGAAVSVVDYDRDGWPDIYAVNSGESSHNALYRNLTIPAEARVDHDTRKRSLEHANAGHESGWPLRQSGEIGAEFAGTAPPRHVPEPAVQPDS